MNDLTPARRRELKALAHHLDPVVSIAGNGLSEAVLREIEIALSAHELIKVRVFGDDRELRRQYLQAICEHTGAIAVQSIGKLLVVWRERPEPADAPARPRRPRREVKLTKRQSQVRAEGGKVARKPARRTPAARQPGPPRGTGAAAARRRKS